MFCEDDFWKMLDVPARTAREVIKCFKETGSYEDRPRSGRPRTARTPVNKQKIKGRIQRNPNSRKNSTRKMAKAIGISEESAHNILYNDLEMSGRKLVKAHGLAEKGKEKRLIRCKRLLFFYTFECVLLYKSSKIIFTKHRQGLFTHPVHNFQAWVGFPCISYEGIGLSHSDLWLTVAYWRGYSCIKAFPERPCHKAGLRLFHVTLVTTISFVWIYCERTQYLYTNLES